MLRTFVLTVPLLLVAGEAGQGPALVGVDLTRQVRAVADAVTTPDKPWSRDLAALTSADAGEANAAVRALIVHGPRVLDDLAILARDRDVGLRMRICAVVSGLGGEAATPLAVTLSHDSDRRVRALAILALGRCSGPAVWPRLDALLGDADGTLRQSAAESLAALGDLRAIARLAQTAEDADDLAKRSKAEALNRLVTAQAAVMVVAALLADPALPATGRNNLIESTHRIRDPRLCPALTALAGHADAWTALLAIRALAFNGDARCLKVLAGMAAKARPELAVAAAETLRSLTGHGAAPGLVWTVWWKDHAAEVARLTPRDALLAALHDPAVTPDRAALAAWTPDDLTPLIDALAGGRAAAWWPAKAQAVLDADDPTRWIAPLTTRLRAINDPTGRATLVVLLDHLAGRGGLDRASATTLFTTLSRELDDLAAQEAASAAKTGVPALDRGAERLALAMAIDRRR
jgi:HEAT repeat protein